MKTSVANTHLVVHSSSSMERSLRAALCFSSKRSFSLLAASVKYPKRVEETAAKAGRRVETFLVAGYSYRCLRFPLL